LRVGVGFGETAEVGIQVRRARDPLLDAEWVAALVEGGFGPSVEGDIVHLTGVGVAHGDRSVDVAIQALDLDEHRVLEIRAPIRSQGATFEVAALAAFVPTEDDRPETIEQALAGTRAMLAFYIGGMGAKGQNYHTKLAARMGLGEQAEKIQDLFFEGRADEAVYEVPVEFADEISLVGTPARMADRVAAWKDSAVTEILVHAGSADLLRQAAEIVLPA